MSAPRGLTLAEQFRAEKVAVAAGGRSAADRYTPTGLDDELLLLADDPDITDEEWDARARAARGEVLASEHLASPEQDEGDDHPAEQKNVTVTGARAFATATTATPAGVLAIKSRRSATRYVVAQRRTPRRRVAMRRPTRRVRVARRAQAHGPPDRPRPRRSSDLEPHEGAR